MNPLSYAQMVDVLKGCEAAAMMAEEVAIVVTGGNSDSLWAKATKWTVDALNRTATTSNNDGRSPYEIRHEGVAPFQLRLFVKTYFYRSKRAHKNLTKVVPCIHMIPAPNHSHDAMSVLRRVLASS